MVISPMLSWCIKRNISCIRCMIHNKCAWIQYVLLCSNQSCSWSLAVLATGVILFEETLFQTRSNAQRLVDLLTGQGILLGIKADTGLQPLPASPEESYTQVWGKGPSF